MNDTLKGIIIGVVSGLISSGIFYALTKQFLWNVSLPLWVWLSITAGTLLLIFAIKAIIRKWRIYNFISEFTEYSFGDSYVYTWNYKRSKHGRYRAFGYEATNIRTKTPLGEMNNCGIITFGHEVPEETIKMYIQLVMIANIDKKIGETLGPVLEYLNWIEDSQKHQLLH